MTKEPIYRYREDHYCGGCIVPQLLEDTRYGLWAAANEFDPSEDVEGDLDELADGAGLDRFGISHDDFPVAVSEAPEPPTFCPGCLNFFTVHVNEEYQ